MDLLGKGTNPEFWSKTVRNENGKKERLYGGEISLRAAQNGAKTEEIRGDFKPIALTYIAFLRSNRLICGRSALFRFGPS